MSNDEIKVRIGTPEDVDGVMHLAQLVNDENGVYKMDPEKVLHKVWAALNQQGGIMGLIGPRDKLEALILLEISQYWYSDEKMIEEICVFVHPDYRAAKGGRASKLIDFAKSVSDGLQLPLHIGILSTIHSEGKVKLYERKFGKPAGAFFLYGIETGRHTEPAVAAE